MPTTVSQGPFSYRVRGLTHLLTTTFQVLGRRAVGKPLVKEWPVIVEIATLFWRKQFNHAFSLKSIAEGRIYFDSIYQRPDVVPEVDVVPSAPHEPAGDWYVPRNCSSDVTLLYFHGGGYSFYAEVSRLFIALLAEWMGIRIFAPDYRLSPEHPHPAQLDDGMAAYRFLLKEGVQPKRLVVCGDSAGGHLALMTVLNVRNTALPLPALTVALSPWTDTGMRGASQFGNDIYDMVQGYMTLQFSKWLKGKQPLSDREISPIYQELQGLPPIYLQAGGKEILVDMIRDFAQEMKGQGGAVRLDVWEHMTHEFHAYGNLIPESRQALDLIKQAIDWATTLESGANLPRISQTEIDCLDK
jgi:acetyl esterase/lipase